jgi:hypothetical protein
MARDVPLFHSNNVLLSKGRFDGTAPNFFISPINHNFPGLC